MRYLFPILLMALCATSFDVAKADGQPHPERAAGLWQDQSEFFALGSMKLRGPQRRTIEFCVAPGDPPPPKHSPELDNMIARLVNCGEPSHFREKNLYILELKCSDVDGAFVSREIYSGDFRKKYYQESWHIRNGTSTLNEKSTVTLRGKCPGVAK